MNRTAYGTLAAARLVIGLAVLCAIALASGCRSPMTSGGADRGFIGPLLPEQDCDRLALDHAGHEYRRGQSLEFCEPVEAQERYYNAIRSVWPVLERCPCDEDRKTEAQEIYRKSLSRLLVLAHETGRIAPPAKLVVRRNGQDIPAAMAFHGFVWYPHEFGYLRVQSPDGAHCRGLGAAIVVVRSCLDPSRPDKKFLDASNKWAATAVLRPEPDGSATLELYDPLRISHARVGRCEYMLTANTRAPLDELTDQGLRINRLGFLLPDSPDVQPRLRFVEPYQPGKIPVVFVHGLLSDPLTWVDMAADLRDADWFPERYQIWAFRYPTGAPFVKSAADLRALLREALATIDPTGSDPALHDMVVVGHSMGGLVSKLLVTESGNALWAQVSKVPPEALKAPPILKQQMRERLFFSPEPYISRMVFIATPHRGATPATRPVGRIASALVRYGNDDASQFEQLIADNKDVLNPLLARGMPTSIDMLQPDNPVLQMVNRLPMDPRVTMHSIIGVGYWTPPFSGGDGVVPRWSAEFSRSISEMYVWSKHTQVQKQQKSINEVRRILCEHLQTIPQRRGYFVPDTQGPILSVPELTLPADPPPAPLDITE